LTIFVSNGAESRVSQAIEVGGRKSKMLISEYISTQSTGYQIGDKQEAKQQAKDNPIAGKFTTDSTRQYTDSREIGKEQ
jgi:hypothetical protein